MRELFKVLIVDDEPMIRKGIKHYINWEQEGFFMVGEAENGVEALELIEVLQPHLVLTDIVMSVMDGEVLTKEIKARYPEIEVIILSSYADFDYVRSTFQQGVLDYVLKPKIESEEFLTILRKAHGVLEQKFQIKQKIDQKIVIGNIMEKILNGYELNEQQTKLKELFPYSYFTLVGVEQKHGDLIDKISNLLIADEYKVYSHVDEKGIKIGLINSKELSDISLEISNILTTVTAQVYLCNTVISLAALTHSYRHQLPRLLNQSFFNPELKLIQEKDVDSHSTINEEFDFEVMTSDFQNSKYEKGLEYALDYATRKSKSLELSPSEYRSLLVQVIFNLSLEIGRIQKSSSQIQRKKQQYIQRVNQIKYASEGVEILKEFIGFAKEQLDIEEAPKEQENIHLIVDYIQQNFDQPLSLKSIGSHFHFNPSYLSTYFSSFYPEGFNDYLNKIRVKEAKYLLSTTKKSISEIGILVGYSEHSYFCKVFKKVTGVSPSQYRRSL